MGKSDSAFRKHPATVRALTVCGIAASVAGAGVSAWAAEAQAGQLGFSQLGQLAGGGVDPLSNSVGTNLSGVPVTSNTLGSMFQNGLPVNSLPMVGGLLNQGAQAGDAAAAQGGQTA